VSYFLFILFVFLCQLLFCHGMQTQLGKCTSGCKQGNNNLSLPSYTFAEFDCHVVPCHTDVISWLYHYRYCTLWKATCWVWPLTLAFIFTLGNMDATVFLYLTKAGWFVVLCILCFIMCFRLLHSSMLTDTKSHCCMWSSCLLILLLIPSLVVLW
jgi:hypothetical protein